MSNFKFTTGELPHDEHLVISRGFERHTAAHSAPRFEKHRLNWLAYDNANTLVGALTADMLWDWLYIDELWTDESVRGQGFGKKLMQQAEQYAMSEQLAGLWLWTQSWQAADFYRQLGYQEFTQFANFPHGHSRIGFRKVIPSKEEETRSATALKSR